MSRDERYERDYEHEAEMEANLGNVDEADAMIDQICSCSAACDPKNYEGRLMLWPDEAWHNWFLNKEDNRKREICNVCEGGIHCDAEGLLCGGFKCCK